LAFAEKRLVCQQLRLDLNGAAMAWVYARPRAQVLPPSGAPRCGDIMGISARAAVASKRRATLL